MPERERFDHALLARRQHYIVEQRTRHHLVRRSHRESRELTCRSDESRDEPLTRRFAFHNGKLLRGRTLGRILRSVHLALMIDLRDTAQIVTAMGVSPD